MRAPGQAGEPALPLPLGVGRADELAGGAGGTGVPAARRRSPGSSHSSYGVAASSEETLQDPRLSRSSQRRAPLPVPALQPAGARGASASGDSYTSTPGPSPAAGSGAGRRRGEKVRDTGTRETPSPILHYAQGKDAQRHLEPLHSLHPVPKFKSDILQKRSYPAW